MCVGMADDGFGESYDDEFEESYIGCDVPNEEGFEDDDSYDGGDNNGYGYYYGPVSDCRSAWVILAKPKNFHEHWHSLLDCRNDLSERIDGPANRIDREPFFEKFKHLVMGYQRLLENSSRAELQLVDWKRTLGIILEDIYPVLTSLNGYSKHKKPLEEDLFRAYKESLRCIEVQQSSIQESSENQQKKLKIGHNSVKAQPLLLAQPDTSVVGTSPLQKTKPMIQGVDESVGKTEMTSSLIKLESSKVGDDTESKGSEVSMKLQESDAGKGSKDDCVGPFTTYNIYVPKDWYHDWKLSVMAEEAEWGT